MIKVTVSKPEQITLSYGEVARLLQGEKHCAISDGDYISLDGKVWEDFRGKDYVVRDATDKEIELWKAFSIVIDYFRNK